MTELRSVKLRSATSATAGVEVAALGLQHRALEPRERAAKLLVRSSVDLTADRAKEGVERERHDAVGRLAGLLVAAHQLDVDVLIERAGQVGRPGSRARASVRRRVDVRDRRLVGGVAETKERKLLERAIEQHGRADARRFTARVMKAAAARR